MLTAHIDFIELSPNLTIEIIIKHNHADKNKDAMIVKKILTFKNLMFCYFSYIQPQILLYGY